MLRLGLTGGIGAGKSTVARRLADRGAVIVDADRLAREVVAPGSEGLAAVVEAFGPGVLTAGGDLDRPALGAIVFADAAARRRLNGLLHPRIAELTRERLAALPEDAIAVHDVPLLVENGLGANYHLVVVVHAPVPVRVRRLVADRGMGEAEARARIASQADDSARRAAADVWLDNGGAVDGVLAQVDRLWDARVLAFEANLRHRRPAEIPVAGAGVPPDPDGKARGERLVARVARAVSGPAQVEYVGAEAAPGVPPPGVLELRALLPGPPDGPGPTGPDLDDRLLLAGFVPDPVRGAPGAAVRYLGADPECPAVLVVSFTRGD